MYRLNLTLLRRSLLAGVGLALLAAVHAAEAALEQKPDPQAQGMLDQAQARIAAVPVNAAQASDPALLALFDNQAEAEREVRNW